MLISALLYFYVLFRMLLSKREDNGEDTPIPYSEAISPAGESLATASPLVRATEPLMALWVISLLLVLLMYGPVIGKLVANLQLVPGWRLY